MKKDTFLGLTLGMSSHNSKLSDSQMKIIMDTLKEKVKNPCLQCEHHSRGVLALPFYYACDLYRHRPFVIMACDNCGFMMHHDLTLLGLNHLIKDNMDAMEEIKC